MNSIMSSFKVYEILRIIIPGVYFTTNIFVVLECYSSIPEFCWYNNFVFGIIFVVFSIFIGGALYSIDYPRLFKGLLKFLPTSLMKKNNPELYRGKEDREIEEEYYNFYYKLESDSKVKTEIQSGFYHFFLNMSLVGLMSFIILAFNCKCKDFVFLLWLNLIFSVFGLLFAVSIYKFRLKYSWNKNYNEFLAFKKKEHEESNSGQQKNSLS